jgi:sugar-phosphatase
MSPLRALLLDLDGLLIDSEPLWSRADEEFLGRRGKPYDDGVKAWVMGRKPHEVLAYYKQRHGIDGTVAELNEERQQIITGLFRAELQPMPGADALLRVSAEAGLRLGLVTGSPEPLPGIALQRCGWVELFHSVVTSAEVENGKPAPYVYLAGLQRVGTDAAEAVAFEDAPNGVRSAIAAGLACVGVPDERYTPAATLEQAGATRVVASLEGLTLEALEGMV